MTKEVCSRMAVGLLLLAVCAHGSIPDPALGDWFRQAQEEQTSSLKVVFTNFWKTDFQTYNLHSVVRGLIDKIDNSEMLAFLQQKGVDPNPKDLLTSANLVSYLRHKHLGTEAVYGWLDLQMGKPNFVRAVLDWQTIRNERGFEFVPTYYLLLNARLGNQKDAEVWSDLFKATFATLKENDADKKVLLVLSLMPRILGDLKSVEPSAVERFAFLADELNIKRDFSLPYAQALSFALFQINFGAQRYTEAAQFAAHLEPRDSALFFCFVAQSLAKDIGTAKATLEEMERFVPQDDKRLGACREVIRQLDQMKDKQESNKAPDATR